MRKQVLINVEATDLRVANLEDGTLVELFVEHFNNKSILGNIYKGRVEGIVPGLKAVFVNIGDDRNAFLHFSDILREYDLPNKGRPERLPPKAKGAKPVDEMEERGMFEDEDEYIDPQVLPGEQLEEELGEAQRPAKRSRSLNVGDLL